MAKTIRLRLRAATAASATAISLCGCAAPSPQSTTEPFPAEYRQMTREYLRRTLLDPYSIRDAEIATPEVRHSFYLIDPSPGWTICVRYNAKNRMGAYAGLTENALLVRGGRISISLNEITTPTREAPGICGEAKYGPFPEMDEKPRR